LDSPIGNGIALKKSNFNSTKSHIELHIRSVIRHGYTRVTVAIGIAIIPIITDAEERRVGNTNQRRHKACAVERRETYHTVPFKTQGSPCGVGWYVGGTELYERVIKKFY
jgi:hypothetical protein